eukprot:CAMPEP_0203761652 /NCGR_PEP_ID=MMETSP0098-20131031/14696_1 /ASSEMBLY_ACC=CAM_ASM_000208 /TAXON_ID=96639 /ORGANISM=" , Strain NY0313808BC1" /LENGTH=566 /DNA_ID=CAMNT_0050655741 /DNA_START=239 /DNA_END=1936 /DNA_ORIENTATION=+
MKTPVWGIFVLVNFVTGAQKCVPDAGVCHCNETYCDSREPVGAIGIREAVVYTSSKGTAEVVGKRLERDVTVIQDSPSGKVVVEIDETIIHQNISGFGGAFTDASAFHVMESMTEKTRKNLLYSYFGENGNRYSMGRVPLGSTDFSRQSYSLVESGDLSTFKLRDDRNNSWGTDYKLDLIKEAMYYRNGKPLQIFMSIWSAPVAWKSCATGPKLSPNTCGDSIFARIMGHRKPTFEYDGGLSSEPSIRDKYAHYYLKFIQEYRAAKVDLFGLTTQNEASGNPMGNGWENTYYTEQDEYDFAVKHLAPVLKNASLGGFPDLKLMLGDDQYTSVNSYSKLANESKGAIDGVGYHWYNSMGGYIEDTKAIIFNTIGGGIQVRESYEKYNLNNRKSGFSFALATEQCNGYLSGKHVIPGSWTRGYSYARDIIHQLNNGVSGWVDWNLVLDLQGGPNHAGNFVDAPILWTSNKTFIKNPMFYTIGQFSAFIPPGSTRIGIKGLTDSYLADGQIECTAFKTPEDKIVVVLINDRMVDLPDFIHKITPAGVVRPKLTTVTGDIKYNGQYVPFT